MFQYSSKSLFSRVREETKIAFFLVAIVSAFIFTEPPQQLALALMLLAILVISGFRNFKAFLYIIPFLALADFGLWFFLQGTALDLQKIIVVSNLRMFSLLMASTFFTFSTDVFALLKLMKRLRFPEVVYLPVYIMFRFLPEIEKDLLEIRGIQRLKGISPKHPVEYTKSLLLPLFYTLFQKADDLAIAYYLRQKRL